jgi:digeranylgeranylglycerophospholipid reductase
MQVQDYLRRFISSHPIASRKLKNGKIKRIYAGKEPIEGPIERTFADGALVVGDSAGHVKSTSGGGIYFALKAAEMAGKTAVECLESEVHDRGCLRIYEARWRKAIGSELSFTSFIRRFLDSLTDEDLDRIFKLIAEDEEMLNIIERHGDTAYQSKLLIPMVKRLVRKPLERISSTFLLSKIALKGLIALLM